MAEVERTVRYDASVSIFLDGLDEKNETRGLIEDYVDGQSQRCAECAGSCGLKATVSQYHPEIPEEDFERQVFGTIYEDCVVTSVNLYCDKAHCEDIGGIEEVADSIESKQFLDFVTTAELLTGDELLTPESMFQDAP